MKEVPNVGIIGQGFVGTAVMTELSKTFSVFAYDKDSSKSIITKKKRNRIAYWYYYKWRKPKRSH